MLELYIWLLLQHQWFWSQLVIITGTSGYNELHIYWLPVPPLSHWLLAGKAFVYTIKSAWSPSFCPPIRFLVRVNHVWLQELSLYIFTRTLQLSHHGYGMFKGLLLVCLRSASWSCCQGNTVMALVCEDFWLNFWRHSAHELFHVIHYSISWLW